MRAKEERPRGQDRELSEKERGVKPWLQIHSWPCRRHQLLSAELLLAPQFATQTKVCRGQHISLASLYPCAESALPTRGIPLVA